MAAQEMLAFLCTAQALAALRHRAAASAGIDPDRISFTLTLRITRDHARAQDRADPGTAIADILAALLPPRRQRQCPREQATRRTRYPKGNDPRRPPATVTYHIKITPPPAPPKTP